MKRYLLILSLLGLFCLGCAHKPPAGYVAIEDTGIYDFRAVSADACYYAVRSTRNQDSASLDFWVKASSNELVKGKGYKLLSDEPHTTDAGEPMHVMQFAKTRTGQDFIYLIALTSSSRRIGIVEAAGPTNEFQQDLPVVLKAAKAVKW